MQSPLQPKEPAPTIYDTHVYEMGYFQDSPYLHPEITTRHPFRAEIPQSTLSTDSQLAAVLLVSTALLALIVRKLRRFVHYEVSTILRRPQNRTIPHDQRATINTLASLTVTTLLGMLCAIVFYYHIRDIIGHRALYVPQYVLIAIYWGIFTAYFLLKQILSDFVNWIFFDKNYRQLWSRDRSFMRLIQSLIALLYIIIVIYTRIAPSVALGSTLSILFLTEMSLFFRLKMIFFPKNKGFLHLMSYLCALEVMPMLVTWAIMIAVTEKVTVQI